MTSQQSLRYHLALLLATHGDTALLAALAGILKLSQLELEKLLVELEDVEPRHGKTSKETKQNIMELLATQHPDKAVALRILSNRYLNKTFLPELRDVRRFCETHSHPFGRTKSRLDALPKIARLLVDLDIAELEELCKLPEGNEYSSLGIISDQILSRERNNGA